ncbi:MAG TPA: GGDEF domain-containing protein [Bryobacteraceae bacterium]|nr:GGDEF domain-containing protein [Bryobacteraceae bacterium]
MISLRKAMNVELEESLRSALESYRAALTAVGDAGARAYPPTGDNLKQSLLKLQERLVNTAAPAVFAETEHRVGQELKTWSDSAAGYYQESAEEVKDLLLHVAKAAAEVGDRDQRYGEYFQALAGRLQEAATLQNISAMRQSLSSNAVELVDSVTRMTEDGKRTVEQLRAQVSVYEERMQEAERLASIDPLTGVSSRRILEWQLERRTANGSPFFVIYLDLNEFKQINDALGHQAGDDLLKQFAAELRHNLRATDIVGRIGGDEFVVVVDGALGDIRDRIAHVKKGVNGDYSVSTDTGKRKISITAAVGIAAWKAGDTVQELLRVADVAMYEDKKRISQAK